MSFPTRGQFTRSTANNVVVLPSCTATYDDTRRTGDNIRGRSAYVIVLFASRLGGEKIAIELDNIPVYFDVRVPLSRNPAKFEKHLVAEFAPVRSRRILRRPFKGYHDHPAHYVRLYFTTVARRNQIIYDNADYELANDNTNYEHMMYAKYAIPVSGWLRYSPDNAVNTYKVAAYTADIKTVKAVEQSTSAEFLTHNTLLCCYDIEVPSDTVGMLPTSDKYEIGSIALTYHWDDMASNTRLVSVIITHYAATPASFAAGDILIRTANERETLRAFFQSIEHMAPDAICGFNSGGFDDKYVYDRCLRYGTDFVTMCMQLSSQHTWRKSYWPKKATPVKIPSMGGNIDMMLIQYYGCINFDVRPIMMCAVQKVRQSSLDAFLKMWNLPRKINMPISRMNELFASNVPDALFQVLEYNVHDSQCCFNLLRKKNTIIDKRSVGVESFVPLKHTLLNADIGRVINLTHSLAISLKYNMSTVFVRTVGSTKYEGALVLSPRLGIQTIKPKLSELVLPAVAAGRLADIEAALTPAIYRDLALRRTTTHKSLAKLNLSAAEHDVVSGWTQTMPGRPVLALDFESLYPSLMIAYNLTPDAVIDTSNPAHEAAFREKNKHRMHEFTYVSTDDDIRGFIKKHGNDETQYGIFARIQHTLKSKRIVMKKLWMQYKVRRESEDDATGELSFMENYYFIKQNTMKVFMNSIYGNMGMSGSPLNMKIVAAAITYYGRYHLSKNKTYVESLGHTVVYGDTDSLYIQLADPVFADLDCAFYGSRQQSRVEYATALVARTQSNLKALTDTVNAYVSAETTNTILRMAYEEVLFPAIWLTRKKYMGIPHIKEISFDLGSGYRYIKEYNRVLKIDIFATTPIFIKGYEIIKRTTSKFSSNIALSVIFAMLDINNAKPVRQLIDDCVRGLMTPHYDVKLFKKYGKYQLHKGGIAHDFYCHTLATFPEDLPPPMKYFSYILRAGAAEKKGHKWVVTERALRDNIQPDIRDYYEAELVGMLSRFIASDSDIGNNDTAKYYLKMIHADKFPDKLRSRMTTKLVKIGADTAMCDLLVGDWVVGDILQAGEAYMVRDDAVGPYIASFRRIIARVYSTDYVGFADNLLRRLAATAASRTAAARSALQQYIATNHSMLQSAGSRLQRVLKYMHKADDSVSMFADLLVLYTAYAREYANQQWFNGVISAL